MPTEKVLALDSVAYGEAKGLRRGEEAIDALAYIDHLNGETKRKAEALIKQEIRSMDKKAADYLSELPKLHQVKFPDHPVLQNEYERVRRDEAMSQPDQARLRCLPPPENRRNDVSAWHSALDNAHSQLEHQYNRLQNLELLLEYGAKSWQAYIRSMEVTKKRLEVENKELEQELEDVNKRRKLKHVAAGKEIGEAQKEWKSLLEKNSQIMKASGELDSEIASLQFQLKEVEDLEALGRPTETIENSVQEVAQGKEAE